MDAVQLHLHASMPNSIPTHSWPTLLWSMTHPETLVPQTYEILTQEDSGAVNVIIRDETGRTVRILRALSAEDAQRLTVDYALIASREPGVAVMIPTQGRQ